MAEVKGKKIKELEEQKSIQLSDDIIIETDPETGDPKTGRTKIGALFLALHPIGSIYLSTAATNPGSIFGGTWTAWGAGRVPVGSVHLMRISRRQKRPGEPRTISIRLRAIS